MLVFLFCINYNIIWRAPFLLAVNIAKKNNMYFVLFLKQRKKDWSPWPGRDGDSQIEVGYPLCGASHTRTTTLRPATVFLIIRNDIKWYINIVDDRLLVIHKFATPALHPIPATVLHEWMSENIDFSKPEEASFGSLSLVLLASWLWPGENSFRFTSSQFAFIGCLFL